MHWDTAARLLTADVQCSHLSVCALAAFQGVYRKVMSKFIEL